jgi:hypothetical protein
MFLAQAMSQNRSCQSIVDDAAIKRLMGGLALCGTHTGAYYRVRKRARGHAKAKEAMNNPCSGSCSRHLKPMTSCWEVPSMPHIFCCARYSNKVLMGSLSNMAHAEAVRIFAAVNGWDSVIT